jgi:peptidoglycan/LPS O-acetylase OafA/YrhL
MIRPIGEAVERKNYLDAVRAVAALLVVIVHTQQQFPAPNRAVEILAGMGQLGVQLFFVLSAYLIFDALDRLQKKGGTLDEFFLHRFLRIAPLYYFAMVAMLLVFGWLYPAIGWSPHAPQSYTVSNVLANVFFIHGLVPAANNSVVGGGWSIGTEMLFYVMAPVLFALRDRRLVIIATAAACYPIVLAAIKIPYFSTNSFVIDNGFLYFSIMNQLPVFICGCLLFSIKDEAFSIPTFGAVIGWIAPMVFAGYIWVTNFTGTMTFFFVPFLAGVSSAFFIIFMSKVKISNWLVIEFGRRAFSIYIFNLPALMLVKSAAGHLGVHLHYFAAVPIVATLVFVFAGFTYRFVEQPFLNLTKRLSNPTCADRPVASVR